MQTIWLNALDTLKSTALSTLHYTFLDLQVAYLASTAIKKEKVQKLCDFRYFHNHIEPMIHEITPSSVLIYRQPTVAMNCGKDQKFMRGCHFCIMNVPCRCALSSESFYLSPHVSGTCQNGTTNVTYLHPVNLALLQEFFEPSVYSSLSGGTSFPNPVTFKNLPQFKLFNHSYSKFLANDKSNHLSLRRMVANAKKDETIFQSLEEPLLSGDIDLSTTWPTTTDYLAMVALGLAIICTAALLYMGYKLRTIMTALVILQKSKVAKAATIETPTFVYNDGSRLIDTQNELPSLPLDHSSYHVTSYYVLVFIILVFLALHIKKRLTQKHVTNIFIEITTGSTCTCEKVKIAELTMCPSFWRITPPSKHIKVDVRSVQQPTLKKLRTMKFFF